MQHTLRLEAIGDDAVSLLRMYSCFPFAKEVIGGLGRMIPWVAEISGTDPQYRFKRRFLRYHKDYSEANSVGSRGVYLHYRLDEGKFYEVHEFKSWKRSERYFCRCGECGIEEITEEELLECLSSRSESEQMC